MAAAVNEEEDEDVDTRDVDADVVVVAEEEAEEDEEEEDISLVPLSLPIASASIWRAARAALPEAVMLKTDSGTCCAELSWTFARHGMQVSNPRA
jgi:hypothetical protein